MGVSERGGVQLRAVRAYALFPAGPAQELAVEGQAHFTAGGPLPAAGAAFEGGDGHWGYSSAAWRWRYCLNIWPTRAGVMFQSAAMSLR